MFCNLIPSFFFVLFLPGKLDLFELSRFAPLLALWQKNTDVEFSKFHAFDHSPGKRKIIEVKSFSRTNLRLGSNEMSKSLLGDDCINIERVAERKCSQMTTYLTLFLPQLKKFKLNFFKRSKYFKTPLYSCTWFPGYCLNKNLKNGLSWLFFSLTFW